MFNTLDLVDVWWSGVHKFVCGPDSPLALRRPTIGGGTPLPCLFTSSPCVTVARVGCTLPGGLVSVRNLNVFKMGWVIVRKSSHDHCHTCKVLDKSQPKLHEIALSEINA